MSAASVIIIVVLGLFAPFLTIVCLPLRALYLIIFGKALFVRIGIALLLWPWAVFSARIVKHGYVSATNNSTGPTVDPRYWLLIGAGWFLLEIVHSATSRRAPRKGIP